MIRYFFFLMMIASSLSAQTFDIQGHRGCRGLRPENTISAFLHALDLGVTTLELDVCISRDGQVVVSHEPYFNSTFTTKPSGDAINKTEADASNIFAMDYAEIIKYDVGLRGNSAFPEQQKQAAVKPLLFEILAATEAHARKTGRAMPYYNIEIKSEAKEYGKSQPEVAEFSRLVYKVILDKIDAQRITLQSFDFNVLKFWKNQITNSIYKKVKLAALVTTRNPANTVKALGFVPDIYSSYYKHLTKNRVDSAHAIGMAVIPWTVNEPADMTNIREMGTDGLITDYPDRAMALFKKP